MAFYVISVLIILSYRYDSRLFNQSAGMDSGFGAEDEYNTYSKPLFDKGEASSVYRPKRDDGDVYGDAESQVYHLYRIPIVIGL